MKYTQGVCSDGAAILKDGEMMTVDVLNRLCFTFMYCCSRLSTYREGTHSYNMAFQEYQSAEIHYKKLF